jgi:hypothetical protein
MNAHNCEPVLGANYVKHQTTLSKCQEILTPPANEAAGGLRNGLEWAQDQNAVLLL